MARVTPLHSPTKDEIVLEGSRRLRVVSLVGKGNVGTVYRAFLQSEARVQRAVALKVFDIVSTDERDVVLPRLARVARHAACVQHPNVAQTFEFGVLATARPYVLTEFIVGKSLTALTGAFAAARQRMPLDLALFIGTEVAEALIGTRLAVAPDGRAAGFAHGDLSMREVLLSRHGEVRVTDFGIARAVGSASTVRRIAMLARRAATVAPEVAQGQKEDACSDVFSLGILLHEMLVGPRFPAGMPDKEMLDRARAGYVHTTLFGPQPPEEVRGIVQRAIAIDPGRRYPHAGALAYDLRRAAMAMGVGDGRVFLRNAMQNVLEEWPEESSDAVSDERPIADVTSGDRTRSDRRD